MAVHDLEGNGIIFNVTSEGKVLFGGYIFSTSYEMQTKIQPLIEKVAPKVRKYFQDLLTAEMAKKGGV